MHQKGDRCRLVRVCSLLRTLCRHCLSWRCCRYWRRQLRRGLQTPDWQRSLKPGLQISRSCHNCSSALHNNISFLYENKSTPSGKLLKCQSIVGIGDDRLDISFGLWADIFMITFSSQAGCYYFHCLPETLRSAPTHKVVKTRLKTSLASWALFNFDEDFFNLDGTPWKRLIYLELQLGVRLA